MTIFSKKLGGHGPSLATLVFDNLFHMFQKTDS